MNRPFTRDFAVEAMGLEPTNLLTASQALYQLSYAPKVGHLRYQLPWDPPPVLQARRPDVAGPEDRQAGGPEGKGAAGSSIAR